MSMELARPFTTLSVKNSLLGEKDNVANKMGIVLTDVLD